ncbi:MAG: galactokinase [Acholeplasmataceae bacterium]|nr:galactokinase [Acholeplasmataceae bacterium]
MKKNMIENFKKHFNRTDGQVYYSPGRVNLIGEHIDYNGGFVFPCALSYGTYGIAAMRDDRYVRVFSNPFSKEAYIFDLDHLVKDQTHAWADYIKGSIKAILDKGYKIEFGIDLYIEGTLPVNAGLSSSSSLELLIIYIFDQLNNLKLNRPEMAILGKNVENNFIGVNSGIMDQFIIATAKKNHAILLNTDTLDYQQIPLYLKEYSLLIVNSNKQRGLADSKYNERYQECQDSLSILKPKFGIKNLCSLTDEQLELSKDLLSETVYRRTRHVQTEQMRTILSSKALQDGHIEAFAKLMTASHMSLKNDYEVTGIELDTLVDALLDSGAVGARMTGAGFGGCVVAIVKTDELEKITKLTQEIYTNKIGYEPSFYSVLPEDGVSII